MRRDDAAFPERDDHLARRLAEAAPVRPRSTEEWAAVEARVLDSGKLALARRRRSGWPVLLATHARGLAAAAAILILLLGGLVYATPRPAAVFVQATSELIELLGEEEVRAFFPGMYDPDRLLEAAIAAR
jgi:hypothetical protein